MKTTVYAMFRDNDFAEFEIDGGATTSVVLGGAVLKISQAGPEMATALFFPTDSLFYVQLDERDEEGNG